MPAKIQAPPPAPAAVAAQDLGTCRPFRIREFILGVDDQHSPEWNHGRQAEHAAEKAEDHDL